MQFDNAEKSPKSRVLIVDDDPETLELLREILAGEGYEVSLAADAAGLRAYLPGPQPDVVLLDWRLPDGDGIDLVPALKHHWPSTEVVVLTSFGTFDAAVEAVKRGAFHFQSKPFQVEALLLLVQRACEHKQLNQRSDALQRAVSALSGRASPIFKSTPMQTVLRLVERVAPSDASVLITGESGTGKEVVADLVHSLSPRAGGPLVKVNCAALPRELIESELFGAVKGAYTGAHADRQGLFRQAASGTILLDEISEMPLDTQAKLLRVLQEKSFRPVGGKTNVEADCRVLASTNRRIEEAIQEHKLREDLYYRISAVTIHLPPLRERTEDILPMASAFMRRFSSQASRNFTGFTPAAVAALQQFSWPGNVRQLENAIQRAVLVAEGTMIDVGDLPFTSTKEESVEKEIFGGLEAMERQAIVEALKQTSGNKTAAAAMLGVTRQTLYNKLKYYGLAPQAGDAGGPGE